MLEMGLPYLLALFVISILVAPYVSSSHVLSCDRDGARAIDFRSMRASVLLVLVAYAVYIVFVANKQISYWNGATDAFYYREAFYAANCSLWDYLFKVSSFEIGYSFITWILRQLTDNYIVALIFWHSLTFFLLTRFLCRISPGGSSLILIVIVYTLLFTQLNTERMAISISFALTALVSMGDKHWIRALLLILCAMSIQISAVIMLPVFLLELLMTRKFSPFRMGAAIALLIIGSVILIPLIELVVSGTAKAVYLGESSLAIGVYLAVTISSLLALNNKRFEHFNNGGASVTSLALPLCLMVIPMQISISAMYRLTLYFVPMVFVTCIWLIRYAKDMGNRTLYVFSYCFYILYFLIQLNGFMTDQVSYFGIYQAAFI